MEIAQYLPFLESGKLSPYFFLLIFTIGQTVALITVFIKTKAPMQTEMLNKAMERQEQLDATQKEIIDNFKLQIETLKTETAEFKKEAQEYNNHSKETQRKYELLFEKYSSLNVEYQQLLEVMDEIKKSNAILTEQNQQLLEKLNV